MRAQHRRLFWAGVHSVQAPVVPTHAEAVKPGASLRDSNCGIARTREQHFYRTISEAEIARMITLMATLHPDADSPEAQKASAKVLSKWIEAGLEFRPTADGGRMFDPVEVQNFMKWAAFNGRDNFWADVAIPYRRSLLEEFGPPGSPTLPPKRFTVDFRRTFNVSAIKPGTKLRLRMPLPLQGPGTSDIKITPFAEFASHGKYGVREGRLELKTIANGESEVTMGAKIELTSSPLEPKPGEIEREPGLERYLAKGEGYIDVSKRIRALAASLAPADAAPLEAVHAFWNFVNDHHNCCSVHYDQIDLTAPCDGIMDLGWVDCQLGSSVLAALCRARGIPARIVFGYLLRSSAGSTPHFWLEAWIDEQGWTPFDFLAWDFSRRKRDRTWRDTFFGRVDYRMTCERFPLHAVGALGVPIPPVWFVLSERVPGGSQVSFKDVSGQTVYSDVILRDAGLLVKG